MKKLLITTVAIQALISSSFACCLGYGEEITEKLTLPPAYISQEAQFEREITSLTNEMTFLEEVKFRQDYRLSMDYFENSWVPYHQENARALEQQFIDIFPSDEISKKRREKQSRDTINFLRKRYHDAFIQSLKTHERLHTSSMPTKLE